MSSWDFKPLTLDDRPYLDRVFLHAQPQASEFTFTNLFTWGQARHNEFCRRDDGVVFRLTWEGETYLLAPIGFNDCEKAFGDIMDLCVKNGYKTIRLASEYQKRFARKKGFHIEHDRPNYDYVYRTESLATLKGWRLDGKRGFVRKFLGQYTHTFETYTENDKSECLDFLERWVDNKREGNPSVMEEYQALRIFIDHYGSLGCTGGVLRIDGQVQGFTFGERLNDRTFVVHFEKAETAFTGIYQALNQMFVNKEALGRYQLINREQDLGLEGLRKAKMSYAPLKLIKKYTLKLPA